MKRLIAVLFVLGLMVFTSLPAFAADGGAVTVENNIVKVPKGMTAGIKGFNGEAVNVLYGEPIGMNLDKKKYPLADTYEGNEWKPGLVMKADGDFLTFPVPADVLQSGVSYFEFNMGTGSGGAINWCQLQDLKGKYTFTHAVYKFPPETKLKDRSAIRVQLK
jgi:hypothetical protein